MYRRLTTGVVDRGQTEAFLRAMAASRAYQVERGIRARTTVWGAITGQTSGVLIASDFERLDELEDYLDLANQDAAFAQIRRELRASMTPDASRVSILRLSFHSDGLITSEDATAPRRYMRTLSGDVLPGHHRDFVMAVAHALQYQAEKGVDARTSVWASVTGTTSAVHVVGEFDSLGELEKFDEMARRDSDFARLRTATRENMAFLTSNVQLMRNLL